MIEPSDFLVDDAYRRVWCGPGMDRQYIVAPTRFTDRQGALGNVKVGMRTYTMPTQNERYHCYMIGDLPPVLVGMDTIVNKWVSVKAQCVASSLLIDLYTNGGKHFPTHRAYFLYTGMGALIIAFLHTPKIAHLGEDRPYVKWRSGVAMEALPSIPNNGGIEIDGMTPANENEFYQFQAKWRTAQTRKGYAWAFVNGMRVKDLNLTTLKFGDHLEYVRDASVKEVLELPVKSLLSFDSILDKQSKYLLPRPGLGTTIDFCDDIDIYFLNYRKTAAYEGYYYHFNQLDAVRMVTHRDYSIPLAYLTGYVEQNDTWTWLQDLRLELIIRESGWVRPLVDEAHRIKELFKLTEAKRLRAMVGVKSLDVWHAANLENSFYPKLMRAEANTIARSDVEKAYGYNAIAKMLSNTPIKIQTNGSAWVDLPVGVWERSTVYEFGADGLLLGWYLHDNSFQYPLRNPQARYVEAFHGFGGVGTSTTFDERSQILEEGVDYRFYASRIINGVRQNDWFDVTGNEAYYSVVSGLATWKVDFAKFSVAVRDSVDFLAYGLDLNYRDDLLAFSLNGKEVRSGRVPRDGVLDIPFGQMNIWLNNHELVPGIDYYVNFPEFCIVNKAFLVPGPVQHVDIRGRSFCNKDMSMRAPAETGFVAYRMLSHNTRFDVRDDNVNHVCIGGAIYSRAELGFNEDGQTLPAIARNGLPYMVQHPIIPMMGVTDRDTYTLLAEAEVIDKKVSDYLTIEKPEPKQPNPSPTEYWWEVFSPYTTKLLYDMLNDLLPMDEFKGEYSDEFLRTRLAGYDWVLQYDPALKDVDEQYVIVQPHPEPSVVEVNLYQYRLLDRAQRLFLKNRIVLDRHLVIVG